MTSKTPRLALPLIAAAILIAGAMEARAKILRVRIDDLAFMPAAVTASVGDVVEWVNEDFVDHTVTTRAEGFDITIPAGATRRLTISTVGVFDYYCIFHPGMTGTITAR
jgi:plastocyanin